MSYRCCVCCLKRGVRYYGTRAGAGSKGSVGQKLESNNQIGQFLNTSTWSTKDLISVEKTGSTKKMADKAMLDHLLQLSGLSQVTDLNEENKLIDSLNQQLNFINQLQSVNVDKSDSDGIHRIMTDNSSDDFLGYDDLISEIKEQKIEFIKGEVPNSWNPVSLSKLHDNDYFIVNEGLIKSNKQ
ncbi:hypothetical protein CANARDRAFT_9682 [[Candida] arabinofermentans NRRL YB-2248]|uniref:Glu-AdT subunit F n=1 Tax=[Candida] arabinofermentans NRRL YB-2248 TaxID=983967 RepID=A0A1E4SV40_9ASCO|nr:hypothetical protein CANARDRAFT_9682 [[Candida] arabinofermentans NRRL YB-2248]